MQFMFFPLTGAAILMWISAGLNTSCSQMPVSFAWALFLLMYFTEVQSQVSVLPEGLEAIAPYDCIGNLSQCDPPGTGTLKAFLN